MPVRFCLSRDFGGDYRGLERPDVLFCTRGVWRKKEIDPRSSRRRNFKRKLFYLKASVLNFAA